MKFLVLSWDDLYWSTVKLAEKVQMSGFKPDVIVGIARGGWVIARLLSDFLDVSEVVSLRVEFYKSIGETMNKPRIRHPISVDIRGMKVLLADDVADTGGSLVAASEYIRAKGVTDLKIAVLHKKPWCRIEPDFFVDLVDAWIVYPHEYKETMQEIVRKEVAMGNASFNSLKTKLLGIGFDDKVIEYFLPKILKELEVTSKGE